MSDIDAVNLGQLDLNLLAAFEALMAERNVTRAAERMGLTQSAMSNTLGRLRSLLGDAVLVRTARGMAPTDRALALVEPIGEALRGIRVALAPRSGFSPAESRHCFRILTADLAELTLLPSLVQRIGREAPGVELDVTYTASGLPADELRVGGIDLAIGPFRVPRGFLARKLFDLDFVCIVRRNHPSVRKRLTLRSYAELGHVLVSPFGGRGSIVTRALAAHGRAHRVAVQTRHFLVAPLLVAQSDLVATVPRLLAERFAELLPLRILAPPIRFAGLRIDMVWHGRTTDEPAQRWFRNVVAETAAAL